MNGSTMRVLVVLFLMVATGSTLMAQSSTSVGYALVSPGPGVNQGVGSLRVFETFGFR